MSGPSSPPYTLSSLYQHHFDWLHGWLRRRLGASQDAADLAQDTFMRLFHKERELALLREPKAYLATVAHGVLVNHWRRQALEQAYLDALAAMPNPITPSLEDQRLVLEALEQIASMLDGLPSRTREIFLLSQLDGMTYPQIAVQLGISVNVVQKAMTRAMTQCYATLYA